MSDFHELRRFSTANFRVVVSWAYDDDYVNDFDDNGEAAEKLASGEWVAYLFRATVLDANGNEIAADYLGGSVHTNPADFMDHRLCGRANREHAAAGRTGRCGSYFSDIVREAIRAARAEYARPRAFLRAA